MAETGLLPNSSSIGPTTFSIRNFSRKVTDGPAGAREGSCQARNQTVSMMVMVTRMPGMTPPISSAPMFTSASSP